MLSKMSVILSHKAGHFGQQMKPDSSVIRREMLQVDGSRQTS